MTHRYWVLGGDYRDCQFDEIVPGTEEISGPFPDLERARAEWKRLACRDHLGATTRYVVTQEASRG